MNRNRPDFPGGFSIGNAVCKPEGPVSHMDVIARPQAVAISCGILRIPAGYQEIATLIGPGFENLFSIFPVQKRFFVIQYPKTNRM